MEKMEKVKQLVEKVLKEFPEARGNDKLLTLLVWEIQGLVLTKEQKAKFFKVANMETITRARRLLQKEGKFLPEFKVRVDRKIKEMKMRKLFSS